MRKKWLSRKFILAVAGVIAGIATIFGKEDLTLQIAGAVSAIATAVTYIAGESCIDIEALRQSESIKENTDGNDAESSERCQP